MSPTQRPVTSPQPLLFVAMPFGRKRDLDQQVEIDFEDIYERAVRPAAHAAGVDVVRADEEQHGGLIHLAMYERLLLAEIVLADLTLANPNVFYELGVRHAARPRATVLMFARVGRLPFDLSPIRAIPYAMVDGQLEHAETLRDELSERIKRAAADREAVDSPVFQLLPHIEPLRLPHEVTESFRDRVQAVAQMRERLRAAVRERPRGRGDPPTHPARSGAAVHRSTRVTAGPDARLPRCERVGRRS